MNSNPVHEMYDQRKNFMIVALTGITGSGCSDFANLMSLPFSKWLEQNQVRKPEEVQAMYQSCNKQDVVFARKYTTCFNLCNHQYDTPFTIIKYRDVLAFCVLKELSENYETYGEMLAHFLTLLQDKFHESRNNVHKFKNNQATLYHFTNEEVKRWGLNENIYSDFCTLKDDRGRMAEMFFSTTFTRFCNTMFDALKTKNYFAKNYFVHRLGNAIRATGRCESSINEWMESDNSSVFTVVNTINLIIKGFHQNNSDAPRRFVIDSVRNSLEIMYLRERYNAFYMIALHNDGREFEKVHEKVMQFEKDETRTSEICDNISILSSIETSIDDFENGNFFAPDIARCVSESEIHIEYRSLPALDQLQNKQTDQGERSFFSYGEQWMKFYSLIIRPGLITPSRDERCMAIAYVAKFNSGCISRQVGCTIVDKDYAIQSVGWNDPPSSQLPCSLRFVDELLDDRRCKVVNGSADEPPQFRVYSRFETEDSKAYTRTGEDVTDKTIYGFRNCLQDQIHDKTLDFLLNEGLPYSYCFRSRYNSITGVKDQVNTRSLHAEENTMLRIAHSGGTGLKGGTMYVTASPCVLCSKKAYQIGIRDIVYLDPYTDIAPDLILHCGYETPSLRPFRGAIGATYYKLFQPFLPYKDELSIYEKRCRK